MIIDANKRSFLPDFKALFEYKDLLLTLSRRDFKVKYAQTALGILWAFIQPVVTLIILSFVFGAIGVNTKTPHLLFTASGLSIWSYFAYVMTNSGNSIIANQNMVKKIYFPRLIIPLSKAIVGFIDFGIALLIMFFLMIYFRVPVSPNAWATPLFILMGIIAALGVGIWLSALTVKYRDFQHVVPFIVQIGMYVTPIAYPIDFITAKASWLSTLYYMNPMTGVIQGFRWSLFGDDYPGNLMFISFGMILLIFSSGIMYFHKVEKEMADHV